MNMPPRMNDASRPGGFLAAYKPYGQFATSLSLYFTRLCCIGCKRQTSGPHGRMY
jgi:hypothetical protein